jgi:hypothetical protein
MFFLLHRWLDIPTQLQIMTKDTSLPADWLRNEIYQLPKDRKYQNCLLKLN